MSEELHVCATCKFFHQSIYADPCDTCYWGTNWEPYNANDEQLGENE